MSGSGVQPAMLISFVPGVRSSTVDSGSASRVNCSTAAPISTSSSSGDSKAIGTTSHSVRFCEVVPMAFESPDELLVRACGHRTHDLASGAVLHHAGGG